MPLRRADRAQRGSGANWRPRSGSSTRWPPARASSARPGSRTGCSRAVLAARRGVAVAPGDTRAFLAPLGVEELDREPELDRSELVGLLRRLGLRSLGAFAALAAADVASRFGADAVLGHRLARGLDPRPPVRRWPPAELAVELELDPPVDRVDAAAFAARTSGAAAARPARRHTGCPAPASGSRRARWRGRSCAGSGAAPSRSPRPARRTGSAGSSTPGSSGVVGGAVVRLRLVPEETVTAGALQLRAVGRRRGGRRAGRARAGPGAGAARAGGGGHRGARRWPGPRGAGPAGALGGRPRCPRRPAAGGGGRRTRARGRRRGPRPESRGAGTAPAVARAAAPAVTGRRPAGAPARRPARRRGAAGAARRPGPAHRPPVHARRRRRAARGRARLGRTVAGRSSGGGCRERWREAGCRCSARTGRRSCCSGAPAGGRWSVSTTEPVIGSSIGTPGRRS